MAEAGKINVKFTGDTSGLERAINKSQGKLKSFGNKMASIGKTMTKFVTLPILGMGAAMVKSASDAAETHSKFQTVFRGIGDEASRMARVLQESYIMSSEESERLLSNTGDLLTGFGFTKDAALDLSFSVQKLSADLASFNNVPVKQASEAVTKALLGERESLKSLGIAIRESDVKQRLLEKGQQNLTGSALLAAKAQATFELAVQQSGNAIGDVGRTSDSFANRMKRLRADVADLSVQLGQELLPLAKEILNKIIKLVKWFKSLSSETKHNIAKFAILAATLGPILTILGKLFTGVSAIIKVIPGLTKGVIKIAKSFTIARASTLGWIAALGAAVVFVNGFSKKVKGGLSVFDRMALNITEAFYKFVGVMNNAIGNTKYGDKFLKQSKIIDDGLESMNKGGITFMETFKMALQSGLDEFGVFGDAFDGVINKMMGKIDGFFTFVSDHKVSTIKITPEMEWDNPNLGETMKKMTPKGLGSTPKVSGTAGFVDTLAQQQLAAQKVIGQVNKQLFQQELIARQLGQPFDEAGVKLQQYTKTYVDLIAQGISPANEEMKKLAETIKNLTETNIENAASFEKQQNAAYALQDVLFGMVDIIGNSFADFRDDTKNTRDVFKKMTIDILRMITAIASGLVVQNALQSASGTGIAALFTTPVFIGAGLALISSILGGISSSFATGGMVTGPTLAMVGDNPSGKEAIIPFERMGEFINQFSSDKSETKVIVLDSTIRGDDILLTADRSKEKRNMLF